MNPKYQEWVEVERRRLDLALQHPPLSEWKKLMSWDDCLAEFNELTKENKKRRQSFAKGRRER